MDTDSLSLPRPKVMVVNYNLITIQLLSRYLTKRGYEPISASTSTECLTQLMNYHSQSIHIDCLVTGLVLNPLDGYQLIKTIRANKLLADIPILVMSASLEIKNQIKAHEIGANDFLAQPIEEVLLTAKVKNLVKLAQLSRANAILEKLLADNAP